MVLALPLEQAVYIKLVILGNNTQRAFIIGPFERVTLFPHDQNQITPQWLDSELLVPILEQTDLLCPFQFQTDEAMFIKCCAGDVSALGVDLRLDLY